MKEHSSTWTVGVEYDETNFQRLGQALRSLGYTLEEKSWGVAGSQEVSEWRVAGPGGELLIEAETYVGLTVTGTISLVEALKECFDANPPVS